MWQMPTNQRFSGGAIARRWTGALCHPQFWDGRHITGIRATPNLWSLQLIGNNCSPENVVIFVLSAIWPDRWLSPFIISWPTYNLTNILELVKNVYPSAIEHCLSYQMAGQIWSRVCWTPLPLYNLVINVKSLWSFTWKQDAWNSWYDASNWICRPLEAQMYYCWQQINIILIEGVLFKT